MSDLPPLPPPPASPPPAAPPGPPPPPASPDRRDLDRSLVSGIVWTGAAKWSTQVITWGATLILARLLTPADFGLVGLAMVYVGLVKVVNEMGLTSAIVKFQNLTDEEIRQLHGLAMLLGGAGVILSCLIAVPLGWAFDAPGLPIVIVVMSLSFPLAAVRMVPLGLLQREFRYRYLATTEAAAAITMAIIEPLCAWFGYRHWSLVIGELAGIAMSSGWILSRRRVRPAWPRPRALAPVLRFTSHLLGARLAWAFYSDADFMVVGKRFGEGSLGLYKMAWTLSTAPMHKITELVTRVTPSIFAAVQNDAAAVRRYLLNITEGMSLVTFPLAFGMALTADDVVRLALGPQWEMSILPLRLLACYISVRSITSLLSQVLVATGESGLVMRNGILALIVMPGSFLLGSLWGPAGVAAGWIVGYPITVLPMYMRLGQRIGLTARQYIDSIVPALSASAAMIAAVLAVRWSLSAADPLVLRVAAQVGTGAAVYCGVLLLFHRARLDRVRRAFEDLRRRR